MSSNTDTRKFIDLVRKVSGKWTNLDPPIPIVAGDYGTFNENGELIVDGNIYSDEFKEYLEENLPGLDPSAHPARPAEPDQDYIVASSGVKRGQFDVDQHVNVPGVATASIKGTWKFQDGKRGALIMLLSPRQNFVPRELLPRLLKVKILKGKYLVTNVVVCPAYLMYLSNKSGESFSVAFRAQTSGIDAGAEVGGGWWTENESALLRRGSNPNGEYRFMPLFALQQVAKRSWCRWRGDEMSDETGELMWQDVYPPWKPLDEDGEEYED